MSDKNSFLWGVVNIGAQTEGYCASSDWNAWERRGLVPPCGRANNYWEDFRKYHDLASELGVYAFRLTIEWSRIEPEMGTFDREAIARYGEMLTDLHRRNIKTVVGLWHYAVPQWFSEKGGLGKRGNDRYFNYFVKLIRDELGELIDMLVILNEPMLYVGASYVKGNRPPFKKKSLQALTVTKNVIHMHNGTYTLWKEKYPETRIGSTHLISDLQWHRDNLFGRIFNRVLDFFQYTYVLKRTRANSDFIGINYYTADRYFFGKSGGKVGFHGMNDWHSPDVWRHFPEGLEKSLLALRKYDLPIYILENGKPTHDIVDDQDRQEFLRESVRFMKKAKDEGVDIRGYFHYALADSYEWDSGYNFLFGLVGVDRTSLVTKKRNSFAVYQNIIRQNQI